MLKASRDKIALGVFILLLIGGFFLCAFYILDAGHNLNVAASTIDDATGELEGYSALIYQGSLSDSTNSNLSTQDENSTSHLLNKKAETEDQESEEQSSIDDLSSIDNDKEIVTIDDLRNSYLEKNAACFSLDVIDDNAYDTRHVIRLGSYTFGLLTLHESDSCLDVTERINEYKNAQVDFIVAITPNLSLLDSLESQALSLQQDNNKESQSLSNSSLNEDKSITKKTTQTNNDQTISNKAQNDYFSSTDFDIVISKSYEGLMNGAISVDGVYYVDGTQNDQLTTILISPSKVITSRNITTS